LNTEDTEDTEGHRGLPSCHPPRRSRGGSAFGGVEKADPRRCAARMTRGLLRGEDDRRCREDYKGTQFGLREHSTPKWFSVVPLFLLWFPLQFLRVLCVLCVNCFSQSIRRISTVTRIHSSYANTPDPTPPAYSLSASRAPARTCATKYPPGCAPRYPNPDDWSHPRMQRHPRD
jgi:hypothetical protein